MLSLSLSPHFCFSFGISLRGGNRAAARVVSRTTAVAVAMVGRGSISTALPVPAGGLIRWQSLDDPVPG